MMGWDGMGRDGEGELMEYRICSVYPRLGPVAGWYSKVKAKQATS